METTRSNPSPRIRRRMRRLERLLKGSLQLSKYSIPGVFIALAGCVPQPSFIALSPDGRYAVVPFTADGPGFAGPPKKAQLILIDLDTRTARPLGAAADSPFWLNTSGDVTVCTTGAEGEDEPGLVIIAGDRTITVAKAAFPALTPDGRYVVFTQMPDGFNGMSNPIVVRDLTNGTTRDLGVRGYLAMVSPDGETIAYVSEKEGDWGLYVIPFGGGEATLLTNFNPDEPGLFQPQWTNNNTLLYRAYAKDSPEDTDLFTVTTQGAVKQLTRDNTISEAFPQVADSGKLVYLAFDGKVEACDAGELTVATPTAAGLQARTLGHDAVSFSVSGDRVVYVAHDDDAEKSTLWMLDLDEPGEPPVRISDWVMRDIMNLPQDD